MEDINKLNTKVVTQTLASYDRAIYFHFDNTALPSIQIEHERVFKNEDGSIYKNEYLGMIKKEFEEGGSFALYNPLTDQPLGADVAHEYLMVIMYSLYRSLMTVETQEEA